MEKTLEDLKLEATELGITFPNNIGAEKLQAKIDQWYENETSVKEDEDIVEAKTAAKNADIKPATTKSNIRQIIKAMERENAKTAIVKVTMVDRREANTATSVYASSGNVSMNIPLDTFVEVPKLLINQLDTAKALIHKENKEGLSTPMMVKKYVIEYK